ncbi:protein SON-like isoform X1 [Homarus americanus]|uniref:protein SON-like isoform X1 n=1 Tax=Homarus americanus TaxID=6706 RepID=UPI001C4630BB|nr:protein SON-like isoform X1 [Homarus americanus]
MGDAENNKTSDEIINELFNSLNVPLSPKVHEPEDDDVGDGEVCINVGDSDNSEDEGSDSKSSESEEETKETAKIVEDKIQVEKTDKRKTPKKKKDKKKKKKRRRKKEDVGRHKHKKRKKKEISEAPEENQVSTNILQDIKVRNQALIEKILVQEEIKKAQSPDGKEKQKNMLKSQSPKLTEPSSKSVEPDNRKRRKSRSDSDSKDESQVKYLKTDQTGTSKSSSPSQSHSVNNHHSRSRSVSRVRQRHSKSRSVSLSKQTRCSRSHSKTKSWQQKSGTRSPSITEKRKRPSRSHSRSLTPKPSKRQRSSKSFSRSSSPKPSSRRRSMSRLRRSISGSQRKSRSRSRRKSRSRSHRRSVSKSQRSSRSRSRRSRSNNRRSRSRSRRSGSRSQRRSSYSKEPFDLFEKAREKCSKIAALKSQNAPNIDLSSIPTPGSESKSRNSTGGVIALESIPLPIPAPTVPDPSSIPLPQPLLHLDDLQKNEEVKGVNGTGLDLKTIPVPAPSGDSPSKEQDNLKTKDNTKNKQEEGSEKGKTKTIIIKSLKDSLVFLQAQEEAERRAKEMADHQGNSPDNAEVDIDSDVENIIEQEEEGEIEEAVEDNDENLVLAAECDLKVETEGIDQAKKEVEEKKEATGNNKETDSVEKKNVEILVTQDMKNGEKEDDTMNGMEEGEIASEDEEVESKPSAKSHSKKKSRKGKSKPKEKRKSKKDKEKNKDEKKRGRDRSRSRERDKTRSRSREKHKSRRHSSTHTKERDHDRRHRRHSRSHSRERSARSHRKSYSRSRSRSKSRSRRRRDPTADLRDKVTRKRLLEIARRNAVYLMQNGCLPPSVEQEQLVKIKAGGKSVDELTDFCKQLVASGNYSDVDLSDPSLSSGEENDTTDKPFSNTRHPFSVRDTKPILMNIRNAPMLPTKTNAERLAGQAKLREQFPVSSGSQHRTKGELTSSDGKHQTESDWVPVPPKEKKEEDKVFPQSEPPAVDISQIVSTRLSAMRKLQDNPHDSEAIKTLHNVQKEMQNWALSKQEPGQFTGTTGVKVLSQEELSAGHQAWARKEQFKEAAPVRPQFGLKMLQKMGWSPGEGLGKNKEGTIEPLLLDVKMDKKGFHAQEELTPKKQPIPLAKDLSGKHPVSALVELCSKRKWSPPDFEMVFDCGPDHKKNFLMKVMVNGQEFKPSVAASTKKMAKANAAAAYLQSLGLFPKDPNNPLL